MVESDLWCCSGIPVPLTAWLAVALVVFVRAGSAYWPDAMAVRLHPPAPSPVRALRPAARLPGVARGRRGRRGWSGCVDLRSNAQGRRKQSTIVVYIQMPAAGRVGARSESGVSAVVFRPGTVIYFVEIGLTFDVWCWRWQYRACACSCFAGWCSRVAQAR